MTRVCAGDCAADPRRYHGLPAELLPSPPGRCPSLQADSTPQSCGGDTAVVRGRAQHGCQRRSLCKPCASLPGRAPTTVREQRCAHWAHNMLNAALAPCVNAGSPRRQCGRWQGSQRRAAFSGGKAAWRCWLTGSRWLCCPLSKKLLCTRHSPQRLRAPRYLEPSLRQALCFHDRRRHPHLPRRRQR